MNPFKVLFTRKIKAAREIITSPHLQLSEVELISIEPVHSVDLARQVAAIPDQAFLAFTSANAVEHFSKQSSSLSNFWKICCLEDATRDAAFEFLKIEGVYLAAANAGLLADVIIRDGTCERLFFICGDKRRDTLPDKLRQAGIAVEEIVVYNTIPTPKKVDGDFNGVVFFSPSAVESFFMENIVGADVVLFSIGATTTEAIKRYVSNKVITSDKSTEQGLIGSIEQYMNKKSGAV